MTYITYITYMTYMTYMTYITYIIYITYVTDSTYSTYRTYSTYITDMTYTLHDFNTLRDFTAHSDLWQLRAWEGEGDRGEKKTELCTFMLPEVTNTYSSQCSPICMQGWSLACSVASLSHPSVITCQIIINYSMIALQTAS